MPMNWFDKLLESGVVSRVRRNHGLEHATLHLLARRFPRRNMAGYSTPVGFWLLGEVPTEAVESAVNEALHRMRTGERELAVHPNCGTNFVVSGAFAGLAGALAMWGAGPRLKDRLERLSLATMLATLALIAAHPIGNSIQARVTTSGIPGGLQVVEIVPSRRRGVTAHHVITHG
jgi:hypothetical protein